MSSSEELEQVTHFAGISRTESEIYTERVKIIRNLKYTLQKWETIKEDLDGNKWYKVEIVRRISEQDLWLKVIDIFEEFDGGKRQNVFHKETSMFPDDFELNQFK